MIWIIGDTHGFPKLKKYCNYILNNYISESSILNNNDILLQLGDLGIIWNDIDYNEYLLEENDNLKWIDRLPFKVCTILGNHCNWSRILSNEFKDIEMFGSTVRKLSNNLFYLKRGNIYNINNKSFYCLGGGRSVDKQIRLIYNLGWWKEEEASEEELNISTTNLENVNYNVDYILTHETNQSIVDLLIKKNKLSRFNPSITEQYLESIKNKLTYKYHFFGHYHLDINKPKEKYACLYNDIYYIDNNGDIIRIKR
jgi:predicted phosphohydrolase